MNASLLRTKFVVANLQNANFGEDPEPLHRKLARETAELLSQSLSSPNPPSTPPGRIFPNFKCANLQGASFDGRTLLGIYLGGNWMTEAVDFSGAKLDGTDLRSFAILYADQNAKTIVDFVASVPFSSMSGTLFSSGVGPDGKTTFPFSVVTTDPAWHFDVHSPRVRALDDLAFTISMSKDANEAKLSPGFKEYLTLNPSGWNVGPTDCSTGLAAK
jgi:hypothetical protein